MTQSAPSPTAPARCPTCGAGIPPDAPEGVCVACFARRILTEDPGILPADSGRFTAPSAADLNPLTPGYEILELIGTGGMGAVYKARQIQLDRVVALKLLPIDPVAADAEFSERFRREAHAMAKLNHPNIVAVHDFGETTDGRCFLVMEFVEGTDLHALIHSGHVTPAQALAIIPQICEGLQSAHDHGIVHRDIKPANILIDTRGTVKITDFGLARILGGEHPGPYTLTLDDRTMGTPDYMAPEQTAGAAAVDHRADIYSLGVVFYELLTGQLPRGVFDPPSRKVRIDVRLDEVVLRALQSEPARRYQHASEIKTRVEQLAAIAPASPPASAATSARPPARWRRFLPIAGLAALLVAATALAALWPRGNRDPRSAALAAANPPPSLQWSLHAQRQHADGQLEEFEIDDGATLFSGDQFRICAVPSHDCHLYVINVNPAGRMVKLYPDAQGGQSSRTAAGRRIVLPDSRSHWFRLDEQTGTETVYLVLSQTPISDLDTLDAATAATADRLRGLIEDRPRGIYQAPEYQPPPPNPPLSSGPSPDVPLNRILVLEGTCFVKLTFNHSNRE